MERLRVATHCLIADTVTSPASIADTRMPESGESQVMERRSSAATTTGFAGSPTRPAYSKFRSGDSDQSTRVFHAKWNQRDLGIFNVFGVKHHIQVRVDVFKIHSDDVTRGPNLWRREYVAQRGNRNCY